MTTSNGPVEAFVASPEHTLPIRLFGLDMQVLLTTEGTGGAIPAIMVCHQPGEGSLPGF